MIDTIVLTLPSTHYHIIEPDRFTPSARWIYYPVRKSVGMKSHQNVSKLELRSGIYKPSLTLSRCIIHGTQHDIMLKIELSLPKLLFGNNFQELRYKDFAAILERLTECLTSMGVSVDKQNLSKASVTAIHYAKNIELTDGSTPYHYLQKIKESNMSLAVDTQVSSYGNDGHSYKWHCNSYEVVFYDKIKELENARHGIKRSIEKDGILQLKLLEKLARRHKYEIIRMEVRLNKRQKIKQLFAKLGIKADLTFKQLYKPAIAKKVLLYYLAELESKRPLLLDYKARSDEALIVALCFNNPTIGPKKILQLFGLKKALETLTPRELRRMFANYNQSTWSRLMTEVSKVQLPCLNSPLNVMREQLEEFKPLINNDSIRFGKHTILQYST